MRFYSKRVPCVDLGRKACGDNATVPSGVAYLAARLQSEHNGALASEVLYQSGDRLEAVTPLVSPSDSAALGQQPSTLDSSRCFSAQSMQIDSGRPIC